MAWWHWLIIGFETIVVVPFVFFLGFFIAFGFSYKPGIPVVNLKTGNKTRILYETLKNSRSQGNSEAVEKHGPYGILTRKYLIEGGFIEETNLKGEVIGIKWPKKMALEQADRAIIAEAEVLTKLEAQIAEYKARYEVELAKNKEEVHDDLKEMFKGLKEMYPYGNKPSTNTTRR